MRALQYIFISLLSLQMLACGSTETNLVDQNDQIATNVSAEEFYKLHNEKGGQILDVRTAGELESGYIPNAVHMDFYSNTFQESLMELDKSKPVFVYCAAGGRSGKAMQTMQSMGFVEVYNLSGGFPTWESAGYDVQK